MEIPPELVDLAGLSHFVNDFNGIPRLALLAQVIASQDFDVGHMAHALEVVDDPFIEMVSPVRESMRQLGFVLAVSIER